MMRSCLALAVLMVTTVGALAQDVMVPMEPGAWNPTPGWTPQTAAEERSHTLEDDIATFRASGGGGTMVWLHRLDQGDLAGVRHVSLRYRAEGIDPNLRSYFLWGDAGDERGMSRQNLLLFAEDLIVDGEWHVRSAAVQLDGLARLALRFAAVEGAVGEVQIDWLRLSADRPSFRIDDTLAWRPCEAPERPISLEELRNLPLPGTQQALALADWFETEAVEVAGARFEVPTEGEIAIATSKEEPTVTEIPVGMAAQEVHLLLGGDYGAKLLTYHGWQNGDRIFRPTQFLVTLHYADGSSFEQIPWCIDREGYGVWRGLNAYALAADPAKTIERMTIRDGARNNRFLLIAATASDRRLTPSAPGAAHPVPAGEVPDRVAPQVNREADLLIARTTGGTLALDLSAGLAVRSIVNRYHADRSMDTVAKPLFRVTEEFTSWEADEFDLLECMVEGGVATAVLRSDEARTEVRVTLAALPGDEIELQLQVRNLADESRRLNLSCAQVALRGDDLWYFYPRLGVIHSDLDRNLREAHDGYFPTQFMDVYDRSRGGGVSMMTRDTTGLYRHYVLSKRGDEVTQAIEFREQTFDAAEEREFPSVYVSVHAGDWRAPWERYRAWLATWMEPMQPRQEWFRRVWNFRTSWLKYFSGDRWFDVDEQRFLAEERLAHDEDLFGPVDMNHFFDWRISEEYGRWGDYDHFEQFSGIDSFREFVGDHHRRDVRVGLYFDVYLVSKKSQIGLERGEEWAVKRPDGTFPGGYSTPEDPVWNVCVWHPDWREYLSARCADVARATGADGVYLDEGGTDMRNYWCWRDDHPHEVPGCEQTGFLELCRETKSKLPEGAVLYTEHAPADIVIPWLDGAYCTAMGRSDVEVAPGYVHIHRFAFPDFKLIPITSAGSLSHGIWDGLRYSMFNGAAVYSLSWGHEEEAFALIRTINRVLREHEDAFLTLEPEMLVPTLAADVLCNRFPGAHETVWTLWNGRFQQFEGEVLRVSHVEGATYRDLWNDRDLSPRIEDGPEGGGRYAVIEQTLGARNIGVVAQIRP